MKKHPSLLLIACLFVSATVWTVYAQSPRPPSARSSWEYKVIAYITAGTLGYAASPAELYEDGHKLPTPEKGALAKLQEVGDQGWELVTVLEGGATFNRWQTKYYFKRPK